jgi:hypothetical protein
MKKEQYSERGVLQGAPSRPERRSFLFAACSLAPALALAGRVPQRRQGESKSFLSSVSTEVRVDRALQGQSGGTGWGRTCGRFGSGKSTAVARCRPARRGNLSIPDPGKLLDSPRMGTKESLPREGMALAV